MTSSTPPTTAVASPTSRQASWPTSRKLWGALLFIGLLLLGVAFCLPTLRRMQAIRYLDVPPSRVVFSSDSEWLSERFGKWGTALRPVERIIVNTSPSEELWYQVALLEEVKELDIGGAAQIVPITESGIEAFANLRHLEVLQLSESVEVRGKEDVFARLFEARPPLREVFLAGSPMSVPALIELTKIESLELMSVRVENLAREDFLGMHPLPHLEYFVLNGNGEVDVNWLRGSPHLEGLYLPQRLSSDEMRVIGELKYLTSLHVGSLTGIEHLTHLSRLSWIGVPPQVITPTSVELLRRLPRLELVTISGRLEDRDLLKEIRTYWRVEER